MVAWHLENGEWHRGCQMLSGFYGISDKLRKAFGFKCRFLCVFLSFLPCNSWFCSGASWGGGDLCDFLAIANFNGTGFSGEHSVLARPASLCCCDFTTTRPFLAWQILILHLFENCTSRYFVEGDGVFDGSPVVFDFGANDIKREFRTDVKAVSGQFEPGAVQWVHFCKYIPQSFSSTLDTIRSIQNNEDTLSELFCEEL